MNAVAEIELNNDSLTEFYARHFPYFNTLGTHGRDLFISRCLEFISNKEIKGSDGFVPTNSAKAIIAASAVQLTLGLETWQLSYFETIIIHPADFDHAPTGLKFRGETNLSGVIKLSWKSFLQGYKVPDDKINLGLHEFSHALRLNSVRGHDQDYFIDHYFKKWLYISNEAFSDTKNNRSDVFRKYGGTNIDEFISVCIEHYFESPSEIKEHYPQLYYATVILLNQQTVNGRTRLNVRKENFLQSAKELPGFTTCNFKSSWIRSGKVYKLLFFVAVSALLGISGFFYPSLFVMGIFMFRYIHYDLKHVSITLHGKEIKVDKGFLFRRKGYSLPLSQLISVMREGDEKSWTFIYYHADKEYFYKEMVYNKRLKADVFTNELASNKIANPMFA